MQYARQHLRIGARSSGRFWNTNYKQTHSEDKFLGVVGHSFIFYNCKSRVLDTPRVLLEYGVRLDVTNTKLRPCLQLVAKSGNI